MAAPKKAAAKKPVAKKATVRKPAVRKLPQRRVAAPKKPAPRKRVVCGYDCNGKTDRGEHPKKGCEMEKGHGGMHFHQGKSFQHVYRTL